ncbi:MAG: cytochrome c oxidase subunit II [Gammaproteobacteria bacterium]
MGKTWMRALAGGTAALPAAAAMALEPSRYNMTYGVTPVAHQVHDLHMLVLAIVTAVGVAVFAVMFYAIFKFRKSTGAVPAKFHENATLELIWTVIPAIILVALAIPATKAMIAVYDHSNPEMTVKVTGYQWKWQYEYLDSGVNFFSNLKTTQDEINNLAPKGEHYLLDVDNALVLPVKTKIRFVITATDVLHAWWVPAFGWKQDAIPGFINENWAYIEEPGTYRGQCAELCGRNHGYMPIVVNAVSKEEYNQWVDAKKAEMAAAADASSKTFSKDELMQKGEQVYNTVCAACHMADGKGVPGAFPALAGSKIATGPVADHLQIVVHGKAGTAMQAFGAQLSDADLAAVITYERNGFGNNTGDIVQPGDVKAAR